MLDLNEILLNIENLEFLNFEQSFDYAQYCSSALKSNEVEGRKVIINVLANWSKIHPNTHDIWTDLVESSGFYPYLQMEECSKLENLPAQLRKGLYKSNNIPNKYFHDEQFELLKHLKTDKNVIVSAPTSFGKSLLIEEIIASTTFSNIVIIQPTLALLDETRRKLHPYRDLYNLIVRTSQEPSTDKSNIFLFTAERVNEYQFFQDVDFLVIDEFYKLSGQRDDERSSSLNNAFHYLLTSFSPKFYLLGPNIDRISQGFAELYNATFFKSNYSLVDSKSHDVYKIHKGKFGSRGKKAKYKEKVLFELLHSLKDEQSIIYCSSPNRVRNISKKFAEFLMAQEVDPSKTNYPLTEWIQVYIAEDWSVLKNLNYDIGIHDGALQKHITTSVIDYFNRGDLKYLFCTSTIIEGINTSAKNIIYFDHKKGGQEIDYFDYSNIKGRAGRMMVHYVGNIYNFNPPPQKNQIIIDIPFFEQNPIKDEVLIQLNDSEILDKDSHQYKTINRIPLEEKEIIKRNGVNVQGQKCIFDILRQDIQINYGLISWNKPTYRQLEYIITLCWGNLLAPGETTSPMTSAKLVNMTFNYGVKQDISALIKSNYEYQRNQENNTKMTDNDLRDKVIQETFQIMKHWFQYKVPKWLSVVNEIQRYICSEFGLRSGNYIMYANQIENDFLRENLSILSEYGIPSSAIRKVEKKIPLDLNQDFVLKFIRENKIIESTELLDYEKQKFNDNML